MTDERKSDNKPLFCSFCSKTQHEVTKLIAGPSSVYICNECVDLCNDIIREEVPAEGNDKAGDRLPSPHEIKETLDEYVIGQERAKRVLAVAVYNHYKRLRAGMKKSVGGKNSPEVELSKSNILLIGPTGSGKTLLAETLARLLNVPFTIADATTLTEAGYVGEDVENIILRLLQAADYDVAKTEMGIIYVDEIDKIRRTTGNVSITRDVSGEGVQQALLKIVEGTIANVPPKGGRKHPNQEYIKVNTENILFIVGGAFVDLDKIVSKRLGSTTIGFSVSGKELIDPTKKSFLLSQVEPEDLIEFGMIPEFVGRFNSIANCNELTLEDMVCILTEPKNAIIKQYIKMFEIEGVKLHFSEEALHAIAKKAMGVTTGARALRMILENLMRDLMFDVPSDNTIAEIHIDKECVMDGKLALIKRTHEKIA